MPCLLLLKVMTENRNQLFIAANLLENIKYRIEMIEIEMNEIINRRYQITNKKEFIFISNNRQKRNHFHIKEK